MYFLLFRIFEQLTLALKNRLALEFFTILNMYFLSSRIFEQLALALKTEFALKFFKPPASYAYVVHILHFFTYTQTYVSLFGAHV